MTFLQFIISNNLNRLNIHVHLKRYFFLTVIKFGIIGAKQIRLCVHNFIRSVLPRKTDIERPHEIYNCVQKTIYF